MKITIANIKLAVGLVMVALGLLTSSANANVWPDKIAPSAFGNVRVYLEDNANSGCWTNLGEAKTYAEDKLRDMGFQLTSDFLTANVTFAINVNATRGTDRQRCYGSISVTLYKSGYIDGLFGFLELGETGGVFLGGNANIPVLDYIKQLSDEMREKLQ